MQQWQHAAPQWQHAAQQWQQPVPYGPEDYDAPGGVSYSKLLIGIGFVVCNVCALLSLTVLCDEEDAPPSGTVRTMVRETSSFFYGWATAITSVSLVIGCVALALNFFPPTKLVARLFIDVVTAIVLIVAGSVGTAYVGMTLAAVKDPTCKTHKTVATYTALTMCGVGALQIYRAFPTVVAPGAYYG